MSTLRKEEISVNILLVDKNNINVTVSEINYYFISFNEFHNSLFSPLRSIYSCVMWLIFGIYEIHSLKKDITKPITAN